MSKPSKCSLDASEVKARCRGRWVEIISEACGVSLGMLDGKHHPCPRCGGKDRFRAFDDFPETGGVLCNQCGKFGDGFAAMEWLTGKPFVQVLELAHAVAGGSGLPDLEQPAKWIAPAFSEQAGFEDKAAAGIPLWSICLSMFAAAKAPIGVEAMEAAGVRIARWPKGAAHRWSCLAFPAWGDGDEPCAWMLYRIDGRAFPAIEGGPGERKGHLLRGSRDGWVFVGGRERFDAAELVLKCEGIPDALAVHALLPDGVVAVSNVCGAGSIKARLEIFRGKHVVTIGDCDRPGVEGARRFAQKVAMVAESSKIAKLPYQVEATHGRDLRDWCAEGHGWADLQKLIEAADEPPQLGQRIANFEMVRVGEGEDEKDEERPVPMATIMKQIRSATDGFPRRVGNLLFGHEEPGICWLQNSSALLGWLGTKTERPPAFCGKTGFHKPAEVFEELKRTATAYEMVESLPHEPPITTHYYGCPMPSPGDGTTLGALVRRFCPATTVDRELIKAAIVTLFWGGPGGCRPVFLITAESGRGSGKSALAAKLARIAGGALELSPMEDFGRMKGRLLSPEGMGKRVALLDNVKSLKFSWGELEGLVTAPAISGHRLHVGEGSRPNHLTWMLTLNGASLSTDFAQRCIPILLDRPEFAGGWSEETDRFIDANRAAIIADCVGFLRMAGKTLSRYSRWAAWEEAVLSRVENPGEVQELTQVRQSGMNVEEEEGALIESYFASRLVELGYKPQSEAVFVPVPIAVEWLCLALGERLTKVAGSKILKQKIAEGQVKRLVPERTGRAKGFLWVEDVLSFERQDDLAERISNKKRVLPGWPVSVS